MPSAVEKAPLFASEGKQLLGVEYAYHWWAGLSDIPGNGRATIALEREQDLFKGIVEISYACHYAGGQVGSRRSVVFPTNSVHTWLDGGLGTLLPEPYSDAATLDGGSHDVIKLQFKSMRLAMARGGWRNETWALLADADVPAERPNLHGFPSIRSPALHSLVEFISAECRLHEQTSRLLQTLADWLRTRDA